MANARKTVQTALLRVHKDQGYSNLVWSAVLAKADLSAKDTGFATTLFYGVLERCLTLDYILARHSKTPLAKMDLPVLEALRIGVYQLMYMDSIPDRAAINESVMLVKQSKNTRLTGFVNGVLRSIQREGEPLAHLDALSPIARLSVTFSVPEALVKHYITHYPPDLVPPLLESFLGSRPVYLRVNTLKSDLNTLTRLLAEEGVSCRPTPFAHTLACTMGGDLSQTQAYQQGLFYVQDPASGYACQALEAKPGMAVLDVCAAPGGKSFTLSQQMENTGQLVACDLYEHKINLLETGARRLGLSIIEPRLRDAAVSDDIGEFDRILCDLPCSGLGILGRKPEIRYKSVTFLDNLPDLQYGILCNSLLHLKPGGILVFSTCTLNPQENEQNLHRLLAEHSDLVPHPILQELPRLCNEQAHYINLFPHVHGTDGFFIAAVRRKAV